MSTGSLWNRWDLHVHTPASIVHNYGGNDPWDRFLTDLRSLDPSFRVVGINDYYFLDGFKRVKEAFDRGDLPNLDLILPVIELRIKEFAGTGDKWSRINLHAIFADDLPVETIEQQFLTGLPADMHLSADTTDVTWSGNVTSDSLRDLGARIRASVSEDQRKQMPKSDLQVGFDHLVVPMDKVYEHLDRLPLRGSAITAVGRAEWADMPWKAGSLATKKSVINRADISFTAAADPEAYDVARRSLANQGVRDRLLDCSDAHSFSDATVKDRIGNCWTWLHAEPTFSGLKHALAEFDSRVQICDEPPQLKARRSSPRAYIDRVAIKAVERADATFFDADVPINPGFVAVIGNKGQGKSAILDSVAAACNSHAEAHFSFLSERRFRNPTRNSAQGHECVVTWADGGCSQTLLSASHNPAMQEHVTYIPQSLMDEICADDTSAAASRFEKELESVLFRHIPEEDRLGCTSMSELLAKKTAIISDRMRKHRASLNAVVNQIVALRSEATKTRLSALLKERSSLLEQIDAWKDKEPEITPLPDDDGLKPLQAELDAATKARSEAKAAHDAAQRALTDDTRQQSTLAEIRAAIDALVAQRDELLAMHAEDFASLTDGRALDKTVSISVDTSALDSAQQEISARILARRAALKAPDGALVESLRAADERLKTARSELSQPAQEHTKSKERHAEWASHFRQLEEGSEEKAGVTRVDAQVEELWAAPDRLRQLHEQRDELVRLIHAEMMHTLAIYADAYAPAVTFIQQHPVGQRAGLGFDAALRAVGLQERFWSIVARNASSPFQGVTQGENQLASWLDETLLTDVDQVVEFVDRIETALLGTDIPGSDPGRLARAGHKIETALDLTAALTFLEPHFRLSYRGVPIHALSPGERGTLLLVFYLLLDRSTRPLLLDQPDENLDNKTIKDLLVPAIQEAKSRRQIIVVTHNPNVAIVADADQVVVASKDHEGRFSYASGGIESPAMNAAAVEVLEGTWPAFRNREAKYLAGR